MMAHRLQNSLRNTTVKIQLEKASSQAKDNKIKSLEELVIELGYEPMGVKVVESLIKKKNEDIAARSVGEVNPLYGQRRSLLAQNGSRNNQTMLPRKFLIANKMVGDEDLLGFHR